MKKHIIYNSNILYGNIIFIQETYEYFSNYILKKYNVVIETKHGNGCFLSLENKQKNISEFFIWIDKNKSKIKLQGMLAHECVHAAFGLIEYSHLKLEEELVAIITQSIYDTFIKGILC